MQKTITQHYALPSPNVSGSFSIPLGSISAFTRMVEGQFNYLEGTHIHIHTHSNQCLVPQAGNKITLPISTAVTLSVNYPFSYAAL